MIEVLEYGDGDYLHGVPPCDVWMLEYLADRDDEYGIIHPIEVSYAFSLYTETLLDKMWKVTGSENMAEFEEVATPLELAYLTSVKRVRAAFDTLIWNCIPSEEKQLFYEAAEQPEGDFTLSFREKRWVQVITKQLYINDDPWQFTYNLTAKLWQQDSSTTLIADVFPNGLPGDF